MKKILEKSGKSQGILSEEKSGNPAFTLMHSIRLRTPVRVPLMSWVVVIENRASSQSLEEF